MKGITVSLVAVIAVAFSMTVASPPGSANPAMGEIVPTRKMPIPKWYYYDQIGLREWNKGEKNRAIQYFEQSYKLCKNELGMNPKLNNVQKTMVTDVINHRQFTLAVWRSNPATVVSKPIDLKTMLSQPNSESMMSNEKQCALMEDLEKFAKRTLGEHHLLVQNLGRYRNMDLTEAEKKLWLEKMAQGKPTLGTVMTPKWFTQSDRDFTPETFTRSARRPKTKMEPKERFEKNVSYVAGKRIDFSKLPTPKGVGWTPNSVHNGVVDPNTNTSWGSGPYTPNNPDPNLKDANKWGVKAEDITKQAETKRRPWGQGDTGPAADVGNKPWGTDNPNDMQGTTNQSIPQK